MQEIESTLKEIGAKNGLDIALDENGACTLELADGRVMLLQERANLDELDFVATLGPVPDEARANVFTELLAARRTTPSTAAVPTASPNDLAQLNRLVSTAYRVVGKPLRPGSKYHTI